MDSSKKSKFLKILFVILVALIIITICLITACYVILNSKLNKINYIDLSKEDIYIDQAIEENLSDYRNIALLGIDARSDTFSTGNRSDCIMIISINNKNGDVKIASVYRDTYLDIDGHGLDKVTHAYSYGGPALALSTLNKNLDLNISEFVAVNFDTVRTAVDSVGGVSITLENSKEISSVNSYATDNSKKITEPGTYNLNGAQALAYSRIRSTAGGDYKRTERMRDVLLALFDKAKTLSVGELNKLTDVILPHISTNISKSGIISMIPKISYYNVINDFGWPYKVEGYTNTLWYAAPVTLEDNVKKLHEELFDEVNYEPSETVEKISQDIVNKTGYSE